MEKVDIILWIISAGFTIQFSIMYIIWTSLNSRFDKLDEKVTDIDRRLCRLEGAFSSKECCMLKSDHRHKIAE